MIINLIRKKNKCKGNSKNKIKYNPPKHDIIKFMDQNLKIKNIREKDIYLQKAMNLKIKYCRLVRKPFSSGYKYFVQIIIEGEIPSNLKLGNKGKCGIDQGTSTIAYYNDKESGFYILADGVEKYNKEILKYAISYERKRRLNNTNCYNEDGTIKKGAKFKNTHSSLRTLMKLKNAYRKKTIFVKQQHNRLVNKILKNCNEIIKEPMDFKELAKKSKKPTQKKELPTLVTKKDGSKTFIYKNKRKKRFGKSIQNRSPGLFNQLLKDKTKRFNININEVNIFKYKASQYNHITQEAIKPKLSDRTKMIGDKMVQRDLYSSFLLYNRKDNETIDFNNCNKLFNDFLNKQQKVLEEIAINGDSTKNFGLKDFYLLKAS